MDIISSIKKAWNIAIHPSKATPMGIKDALIFYYSFAIIPAIITGILAAVLTGTGISGAVIEIAAILILAPMVFFVEAALIHLFGKFLFRKFQKPYATTFTTITFASIPAALFSWLILITSISVPVSTAVSIIFDIWAVIILTIAIMKLQKTSGLFAVLSWLVPLIIILIIVTVIIAALLSIVATLPGGLGALQNGTLNSTLIHTFNVTTTI
jgi:hypothetical protein